MILNFIFLHYADEEKATQKWKRRLKRMHGDNLYFKFNDNDACTYELMKVFEGLPYKSKKFWCCFLNILYII